MGPPPTPRRLRRAATIATLISLIGFAWITSEGTFDVVSHPPRAGDFYDAQVRAWQDGRWDIEPGVLGIEAFEVGDEEHTYFGVFPALVRAPVLLVTDRYDGQLTQLSMMGALVVLIIGATSASWTTRWLLRGSDPVDRWDVVVAGSLPPLVALGSVVAFLGSRPWVYHEAILWAAAATLVSLAGALRFLVSGRLGALGLGCAAALVAVHSRASVGAGAFATLAAIGAVAAIELLRSRRADDDPPERLALLQRCAPQLGRRGAVVGLVAATIVVGLGSYALVNESRFGEPFRLPLERQTIARLDPGRQAVLEANDGSLFSLRFVPTTLLHTARPDAIALHRVFPFAGFPGPATVVGDVQFDTVDDTASATAAMPVWVLLAVAGTVVVGVALVRDGPAAALTLPILGALTAGATMLTIAYVAQRYQGDLLPWLILGALPAAHAVRDLAPPRRTVAVVLIGVAAMWSLGANVALALEFQGRVAPAATAERRADLIDMQVRAAELIPGARPPHVARVDALPTDAPDGLYDLGGCTALYQSLDGTWHGIERTQEAGGWSFDVSWPESPAPDLRRPILSSSQGESFNVLVAIDEPDGSIRFGYLWADPDGDEQLVTGRRVEIDRDDPHRLEVVFDPYDIEVRVRVDGQVVLEAYRFEPVRGEEPGRSDVAGVAGEFGGSFEVLPPEPLDTCRALSEAQAPD